MPKRLCIDPGHGFANTAPGVYDPGAVGGGLAEADIALQWALAVKFVFLQHGEVVFLTRHDDHEPDPVGRRDNLAAEAGCSHFVSIHCNAGSVLATGTECYYRHGKHPEWAKSVLACAVKAMGRRDRGLHTEGESQHPRLAVMNFPGPVCLVELGFITNKADRLRLTDRQVRLAFAEALWKVWQSL